MKKVSDKADALTPADTALLKTTPLKFNDHLPLVKRLKFARLFKRPAASNRPLKFIKKPVSYNGGRIRWSDQKSAFRVYSRSSDKIEVTVHAVNTKVDKANKFQVSCAVIESDRRPISD